ncbi:MAG TPA: dephospho-CoA kinase [Haliangiales bacterium]|nr:dephospho-CoA kinase [Haliangiales bacterium]
MARIIGLTGGIASGKSTVARMLAELGAPVVDADALARRVVEPGQPAFDDIVAEYGRDVLLPDGAIDRKKLADIVFGDDARRRRLNAITHPRIAAASRAEVAAHAAAGANVVIYEAALLVENGIHRTLDGLIVVACSPEEQLRRLMARDGLDEAAARARIAAQLPLAEKLAAATFVVDTSGPFDDTRRQVERVWRTLTGNPP